MKRNITLKSIALSVSMFCSAFVANAGTCPDAANQDAERLKQNSLYKEFLKQKDYKSAYPYWQWVYKNAPGWRKTTFVDGVELYTSLYKGADDASKVRYLDTIMQIYDKRIECWGEVAFVTARKAYDISTLRPTIAGYSDARLMYEKALHINEKEIPAYLLNNYFIVVLNIRNVAPGVDDAYATSKYEALQKLADTRIADPKNTEIEKFKALKGELEQMYVQYLKPKEAAKPWNDGMSLTDQVATLQKSLDEKPNDIVNLKDLYYKVRKAKELKDSSIRTNIEKKLYELEPTAELANALAYKYYTSTKDYNTAIPYFEKAMDLDSSSSNKANYAMTIADCYYRMNKFSESREAARRAITFKPDMGQAYYWIGVLYASSGKLCGPGTGFESQKVLWPAFDYFIKAKAIDPSVAADCDKMMADYKPFLPNAKDVAAKKLKEGQQYKVGCWINESGTVRIKK